MSMISQCPHCGKVFEQQTGQDRLVPQHRYPDAHVGGRLCPGSQQNPRNPLSDKRPLWKDEIPPVTVGESAALEYAGRLRAQLIAICSYAATAQSENTQEWMEGLVARLNETAVLLGDDTIFVWHKSNADGAMWITAGNLGI